MPGAAMIRSPSRRVALTLLGAGALGLAGVKAARAQTRAIMNTWPVGVQLWSVNAEMHKDVPGTLKHLKAIGYDVVETAGLAGLSAPSFRKLLDDNGLVCPSAHVAMGDLVTKLDEKIEEAQALGCHWLVCASPRPLTPIALTGDWVTAMKKAMTMDAWKANAEDLARIAPRVAKSGLKFAYHNHFMDRVDMLHVKDFVHDPSQTLGFRSVDVGQGLIDWRPVLTAARKQGVKYLYVEQEAPYVRPVFESLATARNFLTRM
jgi:sugar phosphate isomerase/epimerase